MANQNKAWEWELCEMVHHYIIASCHFPQRALIVSALDLVLGYKWLGPKTSPYYQVTKWFNALHKDKLLQTRIVRC